MPDQRLDGPDLPRQDRGRESGNLLPVED